MSAPSSPKQALAGWLSRNHPALMIRYYLLTKTRHYEPELWQASRLLDGGVAVDIGGNEGIWSLQLARYAGTVHTFEPNPICIRQLEAVLPQKAKLHRVALSDSAGEVALRFDPENTGIGTIESRNTFTGNAGIKTIDTITVKTARLDDFNLRGIQLIKIDVEGHEEAVLAGATETLAREKPTILCEIEERHNPGGIARIREFFASRGYRTAALQEGRFRDIREIEAEGKIAIASAEGINNFVFLTGAKATALLGS